MEYLALFLWFGLCLLVGALLHRIMQGPLSYRFMRLIEVPGIMIRKLSQTFAALLCGANVTDVEIYETEPRDITYEVSGISGAARVLVPLAPLFGAILALTLFNAVLGHPLSFEFQAPALSSLEAGGLKGFFESVGLLMKRVVRQTFSGDHSAPEFYVMLALTFSLALGTCQPLRKLRGALLGIAILVVTIALISGLVTPSIPLGTNRAAIWISVVRSYMVTGAGIAFALMLIGLLEATVMWLLMRGYHMATGTTPESDHASPHLSGHRAS